MGVTTNSNISANNNDNRPSIIGNPHESNPNDPVLPNAINMTYESTLVTNISRATAAAEGDVKSLNSVSVANHENESEEDWLPSQMKEVENTTLIGALIPILWSIRALLSQNNLAAIYFVVEAVALVVCCLYGSKRKKWRFMLAVAVVAFTLCVHSATQVFFLAISATRYLILAIAKDTTGHQTDTSESHRAILFAFSLCLLQWLCYVTAGIFWGFIVYFNGKITHFMMMESVRSHQQRPSHDRATVDESAASKEVGIDRDLTRAGTFAETGDDGRYSPPAVANKAAYA